MDEIVNELVQQLDHDEVLAHWQEKARTDKLDVFESDIFNYFLEKHDSRDFDCLPTVAYSIFMHGMHCVCWETVRDVLAKGDSPGP